MADLRLCLIGAGRWGKRYIDTIKSISGVELTVLASRNIESAGIVSPECEIFADWREAMRAPYVDAVVIATPPALHLTMVLAALEAGRPVLVEKPMTLSVAEAEIMRAQADKTGVMVMVSNIHLHNCAFQELKRQLPKIGAIRNLRAVGGNRGIFRPNVQPLWDWAPHDLSMCLDLMGQAPERVTMERLKEERIEGGYGGNYRLRMNFSGDVQAEIHVGNMMAAKHRWLEVTGDTGVLLLNDITGTLTLSQDQVDIGIPFPPGRPLARQIETFVAAVREGRLSDPSFAQGQKIVEILSACDKAPPSGF